MTPEDFVELHGLFVRRCPSLHAKALWTFCATVCLCVCLSVQRWPLAVPFTADHQARLTQLLNTTRKRDYNISTTCTVNYKLECSEVLRAVVF